MICLDCGEYNGDRVGLNNHRKYCKKLVLAHPSAPVATPVAIQTRSRPRLNLPSAGRGRSRPAKRRKLAEAQESLRERNSSSALEYLESSNDIAFDYNDAPISPNFLPESPLLDLQDEVEQLPDSLDASFEDITFRLPSTEDYSRITIDALQELFHLETSPVIPPEVIDPPKQSVGLRRTTRVHRRNQRLEDFVPSAPTPIRQLQRPAVTSESESEEEESPNVISRETRSTQPNEFGLYRIFRAYPSHDPDEVLDLEALTNRSPLQPNPKPPNDSSSAFSFLPFSNINVAHTMMWYNQTLSLSLSAVTNYVHSVILQPEFKPDDLKGFDAKRESNKLDQFMQGKGTPGTYLSSEDGWIEGSVAIKLPCARKKFATEAAAHEMTIGGVFHRKITEVIKSELEGDSFYKHHMAPFTQMWKPSDDEPAQRVYGKAYTSDTALSLDEKLHSSPTSPPPLLETLPNPSPSTTQPRVENVILWLMWWSDSTHLAQFGTASLWPIYLFFGNVSKYARTCQSTRSAQQIAYVPSSRFIKLPKLFQDTYRQFYNSPATKEVLTHCKRELMQAVWFLLLDEDFRHAWVYGLLILCADGVLRRIFPRFFSYSADYPEQVLLSSLKFIGKCLCPRCLIHGDEVSGLGTSRDFWIRQHRIRIDSSKVQNRIIKTRRWIFQKGFSVASKGIKAVLDPFSQVLIKNAFSTILLPLGVNHFQLHAPDKLHQFDIGGWKSAFAHLIRMLESLGRKDRKSKGLIDALDERFRHMETFRKGGIRRFCDNVSEMKKMAARNYINILKCAIPCFEGLFPEPDEPAVLDLLFDMLVFNSYASLRLHTDSTVRSFKTATKNLGNSLRSFSDLCAGYDTRELSSEQDARVRRYTHKKTRLSSSLSTKSHMARRFNMNTPKFHALGYWWQDVKRLGSLDSYSTQIGETEHRRVKRYYARTSKRSFVRQIATQERRDHFLHSLSQKDKLEPTKKSRYTGKAQRPVPAGEEILPASSPRDRYHIGETQKSPIDLDDFVHDNQDDPAVMDFVPKLKDYLLTTFKKLPFDNLLEFSDEDRQSIILLSDRIYAHSICHMNYTSYDVRRCQDTITPRYHPDIMMLSDSTTDPHPYSYARVIGIFHANVVYQTRKNNALVKKTRRKNFLWVCWFERDMEYDCGFEAKRLPRLQFMDSESPDAFGFVDPAHVLRTCHIVNAPAHGTTVDLLPEGSMGRQMEDSEGEIHQHDYKLYYVGLGSEADIFMHLRGGGIGHKSTRHATRDLERIATLHDDDPDSDLDSDDGWSDVEGNVAGDQDDPPSDEGETDGSSDGGHLSESELDVVVVEFEEDEEQNHERQESDSDSDSDSELA
ncbi:hypothetical protein PQX77_001424 [Marasmius sp. AFHP31]|nr:hypothetical protein PQX77_001424 [Marasmius sp. AFHP31]